LAFYLFKTISVTCLWSQGEACSNILENADKFNFIIDAKIYIFIGEYFNECGGRSITVQYRMLFCLLYAL